MSLSPLMIATQGLSTGFTPFLTSIQGFFSFTVIPIPSGQVSAGASPSAKFTARTNSSNEVWICNVEFQEMTGATSQVIYDDYTKVQLSNLKFEDPQMIKVLIEYFGTDEVLISKPRK